jgi:DNA-directed RNA polymerase subunit RPC12/RpoP
MKCKTCGTELDSFEDEGLKGIFCPKCQTMKKV